MVTAVIGIGTIMIRLKVLNHTHMEFISIMIFFRSEDT